MLEVRRGHLDALGVLFRRHQSAVHALAHRLTGDASAADDVVQETFLRVLRYRQTFRGSASFTTWLYRVARNACLDHLRIGLRRRDALTRWERERDGPVAQRATDPDMRLEILERGLMQLSLEKREALVLSRFLGLRYDEIGKICGVSPGAIKLRIHRALRELREACHALEANEHELRARQGDHR